MAGNSNRNQQNQSDSEIENDATEIDVEESESRFSVANLTRFGAVAFFVVLGTFAVIHSMNGKKEHDHSHSGSVDLKSGDDKKNDPKSKGIAGFVLNGKSNSQDNVPTPENNASGSLFAKNDSVTEKQDGNSSTPDGSQQAKQIALIPDLGLKAVASMVTLPGSGTTSSGFGPPPATSFGAKLPETAKANLSSPSKEAKQEPIPGESETAIVSKTSKTPPANLRASPFSAPKVAEIKQDNNAKTELASIRSGALQAMPRPDTATTPETQTAPSANPKTGDRFAALPGANNQTGGPSSFNAFSSKQETEKPTANAFSAPKPPKSLTDNANSFVENANDNITSGIKQLGNQSKNALSDAQQELRRLSDNPRTENARLGPPSGRGTQPLMDMPKTDRSAFGSPPNQTQNDTARRNSMPDALSTQGLPNATVAVPPLPSNRFSTPFAREKNTASTNQGTATQQSFSPSRGAAEERKLEDSPAMVRSKAATLPTDTRPPMQQISTPSNRSFASPGAMSMPTTPSRTSAPPAAAIATLDVPGDRQLDGIQNPMIAIQKVPPREFQVNQVSEFLILVKNVGRSSVDEVRVYDQVPAGTQFEGANPQPSKSSDGQLTWDLGTMEPGAEKRIALNLKPTRPGEVGSVAQVSFAARSSVRIKATLPVLEITHQSKPTVLVGDDVIFDVVVKNKGDGPARNVVIQENIPEQLIFRNEFREIEYAVGTLAPGQQKSIRLALKAQKAGRLKNLMYATADGGLETKHELEMEVLSPTLKVKTNGPTRRFLGRNVSHSIGISNSGTAPATNVDIVAKLPQGVRYVSSNNQGTYVPRTHSVFWSLAKLERGIDTGVELVTTPVAVGNNPIKVEATADLGLKDETEQPLSIEHLVDVFFDIDDVVDPIEVGSETQYRVKIVNQGTETATNVQLQIEFPNGIRPTRVDGPLTNNISGQQISFQPIASLKPGDKIELLVTGQGQSEGDHRVTLKLQSAERSVPVSKEESTRVYRDR